MAEAGHLSEGTGASVGDQIWSGMRTTAGGVAGVARASSMVLGQFPTAWQVRQGPAPRKPLCAPAWASMRFERRSPGQGVGHSTHETIIKGVGVKVESFSNLAKVARCAL